MLNYSHRSTSRRLRARSARRGVTLVEMLVSVTITLLVVFAIVQVFDLLGDTMAKGRATIEMAGNLRTVANRLQADLDNLTCPVQPWIDPAAGLGYFKYIEGVNPAMTGAAFSTDKDSDADGAVNLLDTSGNGVPDQETSFGDTDDLLMFTARSDDRPFSGRLDPNVNNYDGFETIEANVGEIIWWVTRTSPNGPLELHRRVLLIRPDLNNNGLIWGDGINPIKPTQMRDFLNTNDISVRVVTNASGQPAGLAANSLADLTTPRNRFGHYPLNLDYSGPPPNSFAPTPIPVSWSYELDPRYLSPFFGGVSVPHDYHLVLANWTIFPSGLPVGADRRGDDAVLSDVLAFDVKVYDPEAPLYTDGNLAVAPHEPGYDFGAVNAALPAVPQGAFVDLYYTSYANGPFTNFGGFDMATPPTEPFGNDPAFYVAYDTWSLGLERDGLDQNEIDGPDEGFDGLDTPDDSGVAVNGVDDYDERETRPPYAVPLTGIEVKIRTIEFGTRQVRQVSVMGDFSD